MSYDPQAYTQEVQQSIGTSDYIMQTPWRTCKPCLDYGSGVATCTNRDLVDVNSDLIGITRKNTKNACDMYNPLRDGQTCSEKTDVTICNEMIREDTRLSNPACNLRSTGFNRWEWLCQNPQDRVHIPFDFNINSKLVAKDAHRPLIPQPIDPRPALPANDEIEIDPSAKVPDCMMYAPRANLPMVSWRSCAEIEKY